MPHSTQYDEIFPTKTNGRTSKLTDVNYDWEIDPSDNPLHLSKLSPLSSQCNMCGAEYQSLSSYTSHKRTHTETGLACKFCGRSCKNKRTLTNHENIHTGGISKDSKKYFLLVKEKEAALEEKIHPCEICGEKFAFKNSLR